MLKSHYIEDIFLDFFQLVSYQTIEIKYQDHNVLASFNKVLSSGGLLTENQANYILKILHQYKNLAKLVGLDYIDQLDTPLWRNKFRVLDNTRLIYVEEDPEVGPVICMKFPFAVKEEFEKAISYQTRSYSSSWWDKEKQVRKLKLYDFNLIEIYEFVSNNKFTIDNTFMDCLANFEEIWQSHDLIAPQSIIVDNTVVIKNASETAIEYFSETASGDLAKDLFLAKSMGYCLIKKPENLIEKIVTSPSKSFWLKEESKFFEIYNQVNGPVAVIVGKAENTDSWVKNFVSSAVEHGVNKDEIRICFRHDKSEDHGFNQWIKDNGYGGKVESGKLLIFQTKPPKWLFSESVDVKIIATNSLYPIPNAVTQSWMDSHPCVLYLGEIKATNMKDKKIVEL